ncbi:aldehyde dehydrogenase domain-containing protein [Cantharellus anzutake]|uniref:aldehyde dehydrogenase domain-containing protein n=1 Tax=Cantharellus anzutake TaxID=1750568 RepID=UPI0019075FFE|nr:aldehyde dehydrogenase domain-containing protein [Cantharellus anzutake]KAF8314572.1 aldehyde dehydrogenase domain-containing protein [Cantharellus anzutake]
MAPPNFEYDFKDLAGNFHGKSSFNSGLYINGEFVEGVDKTTVEIVNPATGKPLSNIPAATDKDVDIAVKAAREAFETRWGTKVPPTERARLLFKLADLIEANADELAALESLNNGKAFAIARAVDLQGAIDTFRYYAGWADKVHGKTIEVNDTKFAYTRHEPIGVVGQITPWNFPLWMLSWKLAPALATGNTIVFKPSEWTPLTAIRVASLIEEVGFPRGVVNILTGIGNTAGAAISAHMGIDKVAFTGSTLVGRHILKSAANSNLKKVTLELGGKSPAIIWDDAELDTAVSWAAFGIGFNHGQTCCAGSRVFVHEKIYDTFLEKFTKKLKEIKVGDPFQPDTFQGPQVSETQYNRIMNHISIGKKEGATVHLGGERHGTEGFFIQPTIFTDVKPEMTIVKEEIFGPVVVLARFNNEEELIRLANDSVYGLAAAVFTRDVSRAIGITNRLKAGTVWVNCYNLLDVNVPFGGYKQSGIGRECGEYALANYTEVKAVHINLTGQPPI